jgi:hypothetical protein
MDREEIKKMIDDAEDGAYVEISSPGLQEDRGGQHIIVKISPAETALEKARRLWDEIDPILNKKYPWGKFDEQIIEMHSAYEEDHDQLTAEIDRLKRDAWTDEDLWWVSFETIAIYAKNGGWINGAHEELRGIISARRAAKAKE